MRKPTQKMKNHNSLIIQKTKRNHLLSRLPKAKELILSEKQTMILSNMISVKDERESSPTSPPSSLSPHQLVKPSMHRDSNQSLGSFFTLNTASTASTTSFAWSNSSLDDSDIENNLQSLHDFEEEREQEQEQDLIQYTTSSESHTEVDSPTEPTWIEKYFLGTHKAEKALPLQRESTKWLKWLPCLVILQMTSIVVMGELGTRLLLRVNAPSYVDLYASRMFTDPIFIMMTTIGLLATIGRTVVLDSITMVMLWHGKQRRVLPKDKRLVHTVVITQYKEPLEVLRATVESLALSTLADSTVVVLACEDRDPNAQHVFDVLYDEFAHQFRDMIKTTHVLTPGEIAGCSANENHAAREVAKYVKHRDLDPYRVMLTICDADSLFDPVYLEHVEAEFWNSLGQGGEQCIYNAPINTYRNLRDCTSLVQACEISRCQYDLFSGADFRPAQSNYSLTVGFAQEIDFWDPSNTSEDFHCTLKAMAKTGKGKNVVIRIWSLILNDSVTSFTDRFTQAKRHMWGIEECAWVFESFNHIRFVRWMEMIGLSAQQMLFGSNVIPSWIIFLSPSARIFIYQLSYESIMVFIVWTLIFVVGKWIQVVVREILFRRWILSDRKHMQPAGTKNWIMMLTIYPLVEQIAIFVFFSLATYCMLWRAFHSNTIAYVVAPKAFISESPRAKKSA